MTVYMLDYYQRRMYILREREAAASKAKARTEASTPTSRIARVIEAREVDSAAPATAPPVGFALSLANGRRIEVNGWGFRDLDLARLIRVTEQA